MGLKTHLNVIKETATESGHALYSGFSFTEFAEARLGAVSLLSPVTLQRQLF